MKCKRLFLVAGYSAQNKIDASLVFMLKNLSEFGDIVFVMDSDVPDCELKKIKPYTIYAAAQRHGEYDFGSYKRAYIYAKESGILNNYDFVYMINDSVYGPLYPMGATFTELENFNKDAFGLVYNPHQPRSHIQSWFIGLRQPVFMSEWFDDFMKSIKKQPDKGAITYLYEQGFTRQLEQHNIEWKCKYSVSGRKVYNQIKKLYRSGLPFMKKVAFTRHNGELGGQILYVLRHISPDARDAILSGARQTFGDDYIKWLLTRNPIKLLYRGITYGFVKFIKGQL